MSFPLTGTCNCGAVQFEVSEPFLGSNYCHCTRCQRRTGAGASPNARVADGAFRIVRGEDRIRSWKPPEGAEKFFCGDCGSALFCRNPPRAGSACASGVLDDDPGIWPERASVHRLRRVVGADPRRRAAAPPRERRRRRRRAPDHFAGPMPASGSSERQCIC